MKVVIAGVEYPAATSATLADLIVLERETGINVGDMKDMELRLRGLPDEDKLRDPGAMLYTGLAVWLARRRAGERLSLEDACDFPLEDLRFELEPGDDVLTAALAAAQGVGPDPQARPGSARASTRPVPADRKPKTSPKASKKRS